MSPALIALRTELEQARAELEPQIDGLRDYSRLDLQDISKPEIQAAMVDFERRWERITSALNSLEALSVDNYPEVPTRVVLRSVFDDLKTNLQTIQAAFGKFAPVEEASEVNISAGEPQKQPTPTEG